jgi:hypothetical protein
VADAAINNFSNGHFRNNLFIGRYEDRPEFSATTFTNYSSMDYNGYRRKNSKIKFRLRYPVSDSQNQADEKELSFFEFATLKDFIAKTGFEAHGLELDAKNIFENVRLPDPGRQGHIYPVVGYDFRLRASSPAVDAGCVLPNVTDGYMGRAPDLGAIEKETEVPAYGPRTQSGR